MTDHSRIDLRSDTVTRPDEPMREAMLTADVGDDVYGEDPAVNALQQAVAERLGKEAALFVPSGTMSNQIAIAVQTRPGDEILCEQDAHIVKWEAGGAARLSGVSTQAIPSADGRLDADDFAGRVRSRDIHYPQTRMICLENTHNSHGGAVTPLDAIRRIADWARGQDLRMHLDGARLWNAAVATGIGMADWAAPFDTVSVCFSKGLGAPVGSALVGSAETIERGRRVRKLFGGAMRQAGILAAACHYAIDHNVDRLAEDHAHAKRLATAFAKVPGCVVDPAAVQTNIVWIGSDDAAAIARRLAEANIDLIAFPDGRLRLVTHKDVSADQVDRVERTIAGLAPAAPA